MIIDSSVVIHAFLKGEFATKARDVLAVDDLCAPDVMISEVANVLGRMVRTKLIQTAHAAELFSRVKKLPLRFIPSRELIDRAFDLSLELSHPIFDCYYLELAIRERLPFVTTDDHFIQKLRPRPYAINIIHLNDWTP